MLFTVTKHASRFLVATGIFFGYLFCSNILATTVSAQSSAGTTIGVTLCGAASTVTLSTPTSDTVVASPLVAISGTVAQANQIEVYIDDVLDSLIPLSVGQTSFNGSVQLASGTHTIKVIAVHNCGTTNGSDLAIVTYQPPAGGNSQSQSSGGNVSTQVGGVRVGGEPLSGGDSDSQSEIEALSPLKPIEPILEWLNIKTFDATETKGLSIGRAIAIAAGMYLLVIGMAGVVIQLVLGMPFIATAFTSLSAVARTRLFSWVFRLIGLLIIILALIL